MAVTKVDSTTSSTALLAADPRRAVLICNSDANDLYVLLEGGTASATNFSIIIEPKANARIPVEFVSSEMKGIWAGDGTGAALITTVE